MEVTTFDEYQDFTQSTAVYPENVALAYTACGLLGEACEYVAKLAKVLDRTLRESEQYYLDTKSQKERDALLPQIDNLRKLRVIFGEASSLGNAVETFKKALRAGEKKIPPLSPLTDEESLALCKELGDEQWYVGGSARALKKKLSEIVEQNKEKLLSRKERGVIHGSGDNR